MRAISSRLKGAAASALGRALGGQSCASDSEATTTFDYLQQCMPLTEVEHVISAVSADAETAALLKLKPGDPCLLLNRRTWSGTAVATVNRLTYAGERYSLGSRYTPARRG